MGRIQIRPIKLSFFVRRGGTLYMVVDFSKRAHEYEKNSYWVKDIHIASVLSDLFKDEDMGDILDAGGGTGALSDYISKNLQYSTLTVLDANRDMLNKVTGMRTICSKIEDYSRLTKNRYDTILLRQVLHYVDSPTEIFKNIAILLKPGGKIYSGQIVAPDIISAGWLACVAQKTSINRKRIWTTDTFMSLALNSQFLFKKAIIKPFNDDLKSIYSRRVTDELSEEDFVNKLRALLTPEIRTKLSIKEKNDNVYFRLLWMDILLES